ncbi:response regulator [Dyadobacter sediminis]|uniref:Response regulator n=1 Tax=Dyadobacter sediminis TaxID=1493691 RepID=A0A5R9KI37_9BACT|nr:response regulator [Dyadobacter sediminis]TLU95883.1 response regulator [Dyadobacter sediminis]GGB77421.1 hypothetical protein GCM10011325_01110 [Dyadobacter sediminis]
MNVLYIDHEINNLNSFKATFRRDVNVYVASTTDEGFRILNNNKIDIIFTDHHMPEMTGLEFLKLVSSQFPESRRVLLTGNAYTDEFKVAAVKGYFHSYLNKPWDELQLRQLIERN